MELLLIILIVVVVVILLTPDLNFDAILDEERARTIGREHKVDLVIAQLYNPTVGKVLDALRDKTIPHATIARALTRMGHPISEGAVRNWRVANGL